ncbi:MAG TPA: hypothetical protein VF824_13785 [Thermoanaerobaculia bacterium]
MMMLALLLAAAIHTAEPPETVLARFTVKPGADEAKLAEVVGRNWKTLKRLDLISDTQPLVWRGQGYVVEVITWRSASIPDNAPPEVLAEWKEMNALAKIDFEEVWPLSGESSPRDAVPSK